MRTMATEASRLRRNRVVQVAIAVELAVLVGVIAPVNAQDSPDVDPLLAVVDDPTYLARSIDDRIANAVAECLAESEIEYEVAGDARFDLQPVEAVIKADVVTERGIRDFVPRVIDPNLVKSDFLDFTVATVATVAPDVTFVAPTVAPQLVDPNIVTTDFVINAVALSVPPPTPEITDLTLRIDPSTDGYGITFDSFDLVTPDPNLVAVLQLGDEELIDYERAFYGTALRDIDATTEPGGCALVIEDLLVNEVVPEMEILQTELTDLTERVEDSPEFTTALDQWSGCLAATDVGVGLDVSTPDDAVALVAEQYRELASNSTVELNQLRRFETDLATADYQCRAQTTDLAITAVLLREGGDYAAEVLRVGAEISEGGS